MTGRRLEQVKNPIREMLEDAMPAQQPPTLTIHGGTNMFTIYGDVKAELPGDRKPANEESEA